MTPKIYCGKADPFSTIVFQIQMKISRLVGRAALGRHCRTVTAMGSRKRLEWQMLWSCQSPAMRRQRLTRLKASKRSEENEYPVSQWTVMRVSQRKWKSKSNQKKQRRGRSHRDEKEKRNVALVKRLKDKTEVGCLEHLTTNHQNYVLITCVYFFLILRRPFQSKHLMTAAVCSQTLIYLTPS